MLKGHTVPLTPQGKCKPDNNCRSVFVDNDAAIAGGWIQAYPKQRGGIIQTRNFAAPNPAVAPRCRRDAAGRRSGPRDSLQSREKRSRSSIEGLSYNLKTVILGRWEAAALPLGEVPRLPTRSNGGVSMDHNHSWPSRGISRRTLIQGAVGRPDIRRRVERDGRADDRGSARRGHAHDRPAASRQGSSLQHGLFRHGPAHPEQLCGLSGGGGHRHIRPRPQF